MLSKSTHTTVIRLMTDRVQSQHYYAPVWLSSIVMSLSVCTPRATTASNVMVCFVRAACDVARSFSAHVCIGYVLPVLWMTPCFLVMDSMAAWCYHSCIAAMCARDDVERQGWTSPLCTGVPGRSMPCTNALYREKTHRTSLLVKHRIMMTMKRRFTAQLIHTNVTDATT